MFDNASQAARIVAAARLILPHLERGRRIDAANLRSAMESAFAGSDAGGAWDWKTAYDVCEAASGGNLDSTLFDVPAHLIKVAPHVPQARCRLLAQAAGRRRRLYGRYQGKTGSDRRTVKVTRLTPEAVVERLAAGTG